MNNFKLFSLTVFGLIFANISHAESGLFVEPGIQYETGDSAFNWPAPYSRTDGNVKGFGVGAKVGIHFFEVLFAGLDATASRPVYSDNNIETYSTSLNAGGIIGVQMPVVGLRVWGEYIFASQFDPDVKNGIDTKFSHGTGYKAGAGFLLFFVSLNLEYQDIIYTKSELTAPIAVSSKDNFERKTFILGLSFPMAM